MSLRAPNEDHNSDGLVVDLHQGTHDGRLLRGAPVKCDCGNEVSDYWDAFTRKLCIVCYRIFLRTRPHP